MLCCLLKIASPTHTGYVSEGFVSGGSEGDCQGQASGQAGPYEQGVLLRLTLGARVEMSQQRRGITHLAGVARGSLGRQKALRSGFGDFSRMCSLWWLGGVNWTCLPPLQPLYRLIEGYMVHVLDGKFFVLEASSVCSNVVPSMSRDQHYVLLCLLGIMRMVVWTTRQKEFHAGEKFSSLQLVSFFRHQLKVKIRAERARLSSWNFGKRWVKISRLVRVRGADLEWLLDAT